MERRRFLSAVAAGGSVASLPSMASARDIEALAQRSTPTGPNDTFGRDDWVPHHTVDLAKDGSATLSISLEGPNAPSSVTLTGRRATVKEIVEGEAALSTRGDHFTWDVDRASTVAFRIRLGESSHRAMKTGRFEDSISSEVQELVHLSSWADGPDTLPKAYRFEFDSPAGWAVASPGERVATDTYDLNPGVIQYGGTLRNFFAVGDFEVQERAAGESVIRAAKLPVADHPYSVEEVMDLLVDSTPVMEDIYGYGRRYPWAAILVPSDLERGGLIRDDSIIFGDDEELVDDGGSVYTHEMGGLYTRAIGCTENRCSRWYINGGKSYVGRYALYETGRVDHEELRRMFLAWVGGSGDARDHEDPLRVPASDSAFSKGTALCAMLDVEIRARTDGEEDIGAWLAEIADQRILQYQGVGGSLIADDEARPLLYEITGVDYTEFYERFVHGSEFPERFFEEQFSLENPWPVYEAFEYPSVELSEEEIAVDEPVEVTVEMRNDADRSQQRTLDLVVDGRSVAARDVQLDPGASTTVTLGHMFPEAGEYVLRVPPVYEGTVMVGRPGADGTTSPDPAEQASVGMGSSPSGASTSSGQPGLGLLPALAGVGTAIGYAVHRKDVEDRG